VSSSGALPEQPVLESRDVRWEYSESLPAILAQTRSSVLISTYQTGHLVVLSAPDGQLSVSFSTFERPMGMAVRPGWLVVGARTQVWSLRNFPDIAARLKPPGRHDACYLTRFSHFTGNIRCHEVAWVDTAPRGPADQPTGDRPPELWMVNTLFSCLAAVNASFSFVPRWAPPFITALVPEDRCHLNGLAVADGKPCYVTALAETNEREAWRAVKVGSGCVIDVRNNQAVCRGLTMPHSPRLAGGRLYLLHSGVGQLVSLDVAKGRIETIAALPGYTRGLAIHGRLAYVGLSKVRSSSTADGVPIAARPEELQCGCAVVDLQTGRQAASIRFTAGIDELFDIQVLPDIVSPHVSGPYADRCPEGAIWSVPPAR
jgi:uncharacterized protein (TIGR03032 family)